MYSYTFKLFLFFSSEVMLTKTKKEVISYNSCFEYITSTFVNSIYSVPETFHKKEIPSYYQICYVKYIYIPKYVEKVSSFNDVFM